MNTFQVTVGHLEQLKTVLRSLGIDRRRGVGHPAVIEGRAMASNTRKTWKRRVRKHVNMGKKRKAKESRSARRRSAAELFAELGAPEGKPAARSAAAKAK